MLDTSNVLFSDKVSLVPLFNCQVDIETNALVFSKNVVSLFQITADVVANQPVRLGPSVPPPVPVISCCTDIASRTLVNDLTLRIVVSPPGPGNSQS